MENYKVKEVTAKDIRSYAIQWLKERNEPINVLNLLLNSNRTKGATMDDLPLIEINFSHADDSRQFFFFNNTAVEITAEETKLHDVKDGCDRYVWEQNCSKINFKRSKEKSFSPRFDTAKNMWEILINRTASLSICATLSTPAVPIGERNLSNEQQETQSRTMNIANSTNSLLQESVCQSMKDLNKCRI